ncbi:uncharacterized protein LOC135072774 [Ostrinia nubilalis]|uniref:uncharacterized protein LOC135072774 n=1 Tax=Ostrinia nubilalis TaxID=29057 RepID=UPI00308245A3
MAAEEEPDALKIYWEHFFKSETGTYEKSTWLDLFLAEFLLRVNDGANPKELIKFCPVSGVVTLVGCELLCGLHRVTSSITAHFPAPLPPPPPPPPPPLGAEAGGLLDSTGTHQLSDTARLPRGILDKNTPCDHVNIASIFWFDNMLIKVSGRRWL